MTQSEQVMFRKSLLEIFGNPDYEHNHGDIFMEWERHAHRFAAIAYLGHKVDMFIDNVSYMNMSIKGAIALVKGFMEETTDV